MFAIMQNMKQEKESQWSGSVNLTIPKLNGELARSYGRLWTEVKIESTTDLEEVTLIHGEGPWIKIIAESEEIAQKFLKPYMGKDKNINDFREVSAGHKLPGTPYRH